MGAGTAYTSQSKDKRISGRRGLPQFLNLFLLGVVLPDLHVAGAVQRNATDHQGPKLAHKRDNAESSVVAAANTNAKPDLINDLGAFQRKLMRRVMRRVDKTRLMQTMQPEAHSFKVPLDGLPKQLMRREQRPDISVDEFEVAPDGDMPFAYQLPFTTARGMQLEHESTTGAVEGPINTVPSGLYATGNSIGPLASAAWPVKHMNHRFRNNSLTILTQLNKTRLPTQLLGDLKSIDYLKSIDSALRSSQVKDVQPVHALPHMQPKQVPLAAATPAAAPLAAPPAAPLAAAVPAPQPLAATTVAATLAPATAATLAPATPVPATATLAPAAAAMPASPVERPTGFAVELIDAFLIALVITACVCGILYGYKVYQKQQHQRAQNMSRVGGLEEQDSIAHDSTFWKAAKERQSIRRKTESLAESAQSASDLDHARSTSVADRSDRPVGYRGRNIINDSDDIDASDDYSRKTARRSYMERRLSSGPTFSDALRAGAQAAREEDGERRMTVSVSFNETESQKAKHAPEASRERTQYTRAQKTRGASRDRGGRGTASNVLAASADTGAATSGTPYRGDVRLSRAARSGGRGDMGGIGDESMQDVDV